MAGQIHAQVRESNRSDEKRFQGRELVTRKLKIKGSGKEFTGLIPSNVGVEKAIEMIASQNGGEVKKKYYEEMGAYEITEIRIDDQLITKDKSGGIHWFIDDNKIPIAVDKEGGVVFLNGEEVSIEKNETISIGLESSTADPKTLKDLRGDRQKVESAHAASRDKEVDIENSEIILFDKETGELTPMCACQEAEAFDYGEISMEKIFVSQITAVENNTMPVFETNDKGFGEIFFSYIEIVDVKESILDRISFVAEPVEETARQEAVGIESAIEQTCSPPAENFSAPITMNYTSPDVTTEVYMIPKRKDILPPAPGYFKIPGAENTKPVKEKPKKKLKLINYSPKIEKIEKYEAKKPEKYPPRIEIRKTEFDVQKIGYEKPKIKPTKVKTKTPRAKRKRKKRRAIEIVRKTASKIKKTRQRIQKLIKVKRKKMVQEKIKIKKTEKKTKTGISKKPKTKQEIKIKAKKEKIIKKKKKPKIKLKKKIKKHILSSYF